jgi:hypothetical protein
MAASAEMLAGLIRFLFVNSDVGQFGYLLALRNPACVLYRWLQHVIGNYLAAQSGLLVYQLRHSAAAISSLRGFAEEPCELRP